MPREERDRPRPSKFQSLTDYLAALPDDRVTLSFAVLEAIFGGPLPMAAYITSWWWHNPNFAHVRGWEAVGWRARYDRLNECVHFTRDAEEAADARG